MEFLERGLAAQASTHEPIGVGANYRLEAAGAAGAALVYNDTLVHLALFAVPDGGAKPVELPRPAAPAAPAAPTTESHGQTSATPPARPWWQRLLGG